MLKDSSQALLRRLSIDKVAALRYYTNMVDKLKRIKFVGEFIKKKRVELGMSQRSLGLLVTPPVTTQFISNIERGITPLPPGHIPLIAKALATSESELMAILEKEYALKLSGRLGKPEGDSVPVHSADGHLLAVSTQDYVFMKQLYSAIRAADTQSRSEFVLACENLLKLPKLSP
jgi:transcriptional regulator with XRE-family HTH domain